MLVCDCLCMTCVLLFLLALNYNYPFACQEPCSSVALPGLPYESTQVQISPLPLVTLNY